MQVEIRQYRRGDARQAADVWNEVVEAGAAFPQEELLDGETGDAFFQSQSFTGVACDAETGAVVGLYILHPNNVGRCGHICNASYAVRDGLRGQHIGEALVRHCMATAKGLGFRVLQFNAVVATNQPALRLYARLGFVQLGVIPGGFRNRDGVYEDIIPHYHLL
nr:GNAT family N-acetyltransferase [uncultured Agathobaculum sp.]